MPALLTDHGSDLTDEARYLLLFLVKEKFRRHLDPAVSHDDESQNAVLIALRTTWGYDPTKGKLSTWLSRIVATACEREQRFSRRMCRDRRRTRPLPERPRFRCRETDPLERLIELEEAAA
jgi:hypothetical protein